MLPFPIFAVWSVLFLHHFWWLVIDDVSWLLIPYHWSTQVWKRFALAQAKVNTSIYHMLKLTSITKESMAEFPIAMKLDSQELHIISHKRKCINVIYALDSLSWRWKVLSRFCWLWTPFRQFAPTHLPWSKYHRVATTNLYLATENEDHLLNWFSFKCYVSAFFFRECPEVTANFLYEMIIHLCKWR